MPKVFDILRVTLAASTWTNIVVPVQCSRVVIENADTGNTMRVRLEEGGSEKVIAAGLELDINTYGSGGIAPGVLCQVFAAGTGPAVVTFTR